MNDIPLVRTNNVDDINTSLIAVKKTIGEKGDIREVNVDVSVHTDAVDEVTLGEMSPVTSNAVSVALSEESNNRNSAITNAIGNLSADSVGGSGKYISAISEANGVISATANNLATTVQSGNNQPVTSNAVADALTTNKGQNYCFIPDARGLDKYTTVRFSRTDWGFVPNDSYGIVMTYYNGEDYFINAKTGEAHPTDPFNSRAQLSYLYGIYVDINNGLLYISHSGYRGFFIRFQGNLISVETSTTAPSGITFNNIVFTPNTTTREIKGEIEEER